MIDRHELACELNDFCKDFDPYEYNNELDPTHTEEDIIHELEDALSTADGTLEIHEGLQDLVSEAEMDDDLQAQYDSVYNNLNTYMSENNFVKKDSWKSIEQSPVAIQEFRHPEVPVIGFSEPGLCNGQLASAHFGRDRVAHAVRQFLNANKDVPNVSSPFDDSGRIVDKYFLYEDYDKNLALSHWNEIGEKYGDRMDAIVLPMLERNDEENRFKPKYKDVVLSFGSTLYQSQEAGLSDKSIDYMMDHAKTSAQESGRIDFETLDYLKNSFVYGYYDNVVFMDQYVTPEARQAVDFYLEEHLFEKEPVSAIGACKDVGAAYWVYRALEEKKATISEAKSLAELSNMVHDRVQEDNKRYLESDSQDASSVRRWGLSDVESTVHQLLELRDNYGFDLNSEDARTFMKDYLNSGTVMDLPSYGMFYKDLDKLSEEDKKSHAMSIEDVLKHTNEALSMSPKDAYFKSGDNQIDIIGNVIESSYEYFRPALTLYENGELLYHEDAACVDNYHNEVYTQGRFTSSNDAIDYLKDKYKDANDWVSVDSPAPIVKKDYPYVWCNPTYGKYREARDNGTYEQLLDRVVFKDLGLATGRNGLPYHRVDFAYACDQKTFGEDAAMANPYLMSSKRKNEAGKLETVHSYYLSSDIYSRLMAYANTDGLENSQWTGVVAAKVTYPTTRNGHSKVSVNLTNSAQKNGDIITPKEPFDEKKHNQFVKASMAEVHAKREKSARALSSDVASPENTGASFEA